MRDVSSGNHFHAITVCRQCAHLSCPVILETKQDVEKFFGGLDKDLNKAADTFNSDVHIELEVLIPNEVVRLTTGNSHEDGHDVIMMVHECSDEWEFCRMNHAAQMASELAAKMMEMMRLAFNKSVDERSKSKPKDASQRILESLDLSDDMFSGMN
jgi:hypothetical protein